MLRSFSPVMVLCVVLLCLAPEAEAQRHLCNKAGTDCTVPDVQAGEEETPPPDATLSFDSGVAGASSEKRVGGRQISRRATQYIALASRGGSNPTYTLASSNWNGDKYRTCLWIGASADQKLKIIRSYFEFSIASSKTKSSGSGFTFAAIPAGTEVDATHIPCGGSGGYLGYQNAGDQGDMPDEKFAVEWDVQDDGTSGFHDPANNHMAIDRQAVTHNGQASEGPKCPGGGATANELTDAAACAVGNDTAWFEDGSTNKNSNEFHPVRVETAYVSSGNCASGGQSFAASPASPYVKVTAYMWGLYTRSRTCLKYDDRRPDRCVKYSRDVWTAPCANCKSNLGQNYADIAPNSDSSPIAVTTHCVPVTADMDKIHLGWTAGTNSRPITLQIRGFGAKVD